MSASRENSPETPVVRVASLIVLIVLIGKIVFMGLIDLIPEEAYYWNYAQHLDIGYLDHPPLVAWLVWLSTSVFGNTEFGVRLPAFLSWIVLAVYMFRLTRDVVGRTAAFGCVSLLAVLPIYWSVGFLMTPDAPLYAAWAGALFYTRAAIVDAKPGAWIGAGIWMGVGLLAKYTMSLLGAATIVFLLLDPEARKCLKSPGPYLAAAIAALMFTPVLIWNFRNDWASFAFQGSRRWSLAHEFNLHVLVGSALLLLTPLGLWEAIAGLARLIKMQFAGTKPDPADGRNARFAVIFCGVPLSVFVTHSMCNQTKLNWTGPVWLIMLPWIADRMLSAPTVGWGRSATGLKRTWATAIIFLLVLYPAGLVWILAGAPGWPAQSWYQLPIAWRDFGQAVEHIETTVKKESGVEPLIVGMDKYWIASEASFYATPDGDTRTEFAGRDVVGGGALMWSHWDRLKTKESRTMILIGFDAKDLDRPALAQICSGLGPVTTQKIKRHSREIGQFYWRLAHSCRQTTGP